MQDQHWANRFRAWISHGYRRRSNASHSHLRRFCIRLNPCARRYRGYLNSGRRRWHAHQQRCRRRICPPPHLRLQWRCILLEYLRARLHPHQGRALAALLQTHVFGWQRHCLIGPDWGRSAKPVTRESRARQRNIQILPNHPRRRDCCGHRHTRPLNTHRPRHLGHPIHPRLRRREGRPLRCGENFTLRPPTLPHRLRYRPLALQTDHLLHDCHCVRRRNGPSRGNLHQGRSRRQSAFRPRLEGPRQRASIRAGFAILDPWQNRLGRYRLRGMHHCRRSCRKRQRMGGNWLRERRPAHFDHLTCRRPDWLRNIGPRSEGSLDPHRALHRRPWVRTSAVLGRLRRPPVDTRCTMHRKWCVTMNKIGS